MLRCPTCKITFSHCFPCRCSRCAHRWPILTSLCFSSVFSCQSRPRRKKKKTINLKFHPNGHTQPTHQKPLDRSRRREKRGSWSCVCLDIYVCTWVIISAKERPKLPGWRRFLSVFPWSERWGWKIGTSLLDSLTKVWRRFPYKTCTCHHSHAILPRSSPYGEKSRYFENIFEHTSIVDPRQERY